MEGRKRKAQAEANPSSSASKKLRLLNSHHPPADPPENQVQTVGLKLIAQLNNATDKTGRAIADAFIELPPRDELPDYYEQIKLPVAIDTIEDKLKRNQYPTITAVESDFKRLIQNAKDYNMPKSDIYEDAERIRKLVYNFMKIHNPQYQTDPSYSAFPTPISQGTHALTNGNHNGAEVKRESASRDGSVKPRLSLAPKVSEPPSDRKASVAPSATTGGGDDDDDADEDEDMDFTGKSFQAAQQMILAELLRYADDDGLEIFTPFANLPSRRLEDYYKLIKHPVSIKGVQKRTRGVHGRDPPTGVTDFKTWDAFEEEVSFIWRNAREYNEDGSTMFELAGEFEDHFKMRLAEAKEKVEEPAGTRIKIGGPKPKSGITLNLSQNRGSPATGVSVDNEALARQRQMVQAGVNGHQTQQRPNLIPNGTSSTDSVRPASAAGTSASAIAKPEKLPSQSPAPQSFPQPNGVMAPPGMRPSSGSPYPNLYPGNLSHSSYTANSYHYTAPAALPPIAVRTYPISQALLPAVTLNTHAQLHLANPYRLRIPPHVVLAQQSTTITLPATHYFLQISPTISRELSMGRAYKMFITVNGTRLQQRDTQFHADTGQRTHVYEGTLASGVNRIEVEVAAAKADGGEGKSLDVEKVTVFANLMR